MAGVKDEKFLPELAGRAKLLLEMADLPYEAIQKFYSKEEENESVGSV